MKTRSEQIAGGWPPVSAVVITYQPGPRLLDNIRRLSEQAAEIIMVDNGSGTDSAPWIESAEAIPGVSLIRNGANRGIASALNIGIRHALQFGRSWIATFDQDSAIPEHYFEQLFQALDTCPSPHVVGMMAPGGWAENHPSAGPASPGNPPWTFAQGAITSGSVIRADIFNRTGFYDDAFFIDYVDTDFCLRLRKHEFKILSVSSVFLKHELGEKQMLPGLKLSFRVHAPWRYYYIMRNRILVYRRYLNFFPLWVLRDASWLILELGRIACLEKERRPKLQAAFRGIRDGLRGKTGRHPLFPPSHN